MSTDEPIDLFEPTAPVPGTEDAGEVEEIEADFVPRPKQRLGASTAALAALLVAGLGFVGGVQVQKSRATTSAQAGTLSGLGSLRGQGFPGGALPSGAGFPGGFTPTGDGQGTGGGTNSTGPTVIGTVVSVKGNTLTVKNFAGKTITVAITDDTAVSQAIKASALRTGQAVTVSGPTGADGTVAATRVTAR